MGKSEVIMNTTNTSIISENIDYNPQQVDSVGSFPIFAFPDFLRIVIPSKDDIFKRKTEKLEIEKLNIPKDVDILEFAKNFYLDHKEALLKKYRNRYVAILNNKVVGSDKDFSKLAQRVYAKYGYQTIYMPFVEIEERIVRITSPRIKI
ncbi:MAG: DUF5678 domain-containing protein [Candidatus Sumerlaeota bacterium]|nr:DUF5678 domain-containing protein [Candidatus Sumerlaeota bacterium]